MRHIAPRVLTGTHFMLGNHAVVEGALAAGCDFFAGYPITPANEISQYMSERMPAVGGKFLQGEDELCSIFSLSGAALLAGAKAMTATASAGFNYLLEGIGYAVAAEVPMVIVDVQRCRGENFATQADVMQLRWGASGDHEHIVLAPASVQELFDFTVRAFNLAEKYRTPVIVMSETTIALMREKLVIPPADQIEIVRRNKPTVPRDEFLPFQAEADGCAPSAEFRRRLSHPAFSQPARHSRGIAWDPEVFDNLYRRIVGKVANHRDDIVQVTRFQLEDADIVLIAYGSEARSSLAALRRARAEGVKVGLLKLDTVWPVPEAEIRQAVSQAKTVVAVEMNIGKYAGEIERVVAGRCPVVRATKNRGLVHTTQELLDVIKEIRI